MTLSDRSEWTKEEKDPHKLAWFNKLTGLIQKKRVAQGLKKLEEAEIKLNVG